MNRIKRWLGLAPAEPYLGELPLLGEHELRAADAGIPLPIVEGRVRERPIMAPITWTDSSPRLAVDWGMDRDPVGGLLPYWVRVEDFGIVARCETKDDAKMVHDALARVWSD